MVRMKRVRLKLNRNLSPEELERLIEEAWEEIVRREVERVLSD